MRQDHEPCLYRFKTNKTAYLSGSKSEIGNYYNRFMFKSAAMFSARVPLLLNKRSEKIPNLFGAVSSPWLLLSGSSSQPSSVLTHRNITHQTATRAEIVHWCRIRQQNEADGEETAQPSWKNAKSETTAQLFRHKSTAGRSGVKNAERGQAQTNSQISEPLGQQIFKARCQQSQHPFRAVFVDCYSGT